MRIEQITLPTSGIDWQAVLQAWSWLFSKTTTFNVWLLTRFGELFIHMEDDSIWRLDPSCGEFENVAASKDEFCNLIDQSDNAELWFMPTLIEDLESRGSLLKDGDCYGFTVPTGMGGEFTAENIRIVKVEYYFRAMADLWGRLRDVPDGTEVNFNLDW